MSKVLKAEAIGDRAVRFELGDSDDRELPLILGLMPVLPEARHRSRDIREYDSSIRRSAAVPMSSVR